MSTIRVEFPAPEGSMFAPGALDENIGKNLSCGLLIAVDYADDGSRAALAFERSDPIAPVG